MTKIDKIEDFIAWLKEQPAGTKFAETTLLHSSCPLASYSGGIVGRITAGEGEDHYTMPKWASKFACQANYGMSVEDALTLAESLKT